MEQITLAEIQKHLARYKENYVKYNQINEAYRLSTNHGDWNAAITNKSLQTRDIYQDNENILKVLSRFLEQPLTEESALFLYDYVLSLYLEWFDDYQLMMIINRY